jgi:hypothetical protein
MGDPAENVYETVKPLGKTTRFGWRRPKGITFRLMPPFLRHMPDFYAESGYAVEVMGLGRDGILKSMKTTKYEVLKKWKRVLAAEDIGMKLFIWNSHAKEWAIVDWPAVVKMVNKSVKQYGIQVFENDKNEYYRIDWEWIIDNAEFTAPHDV